MLPSTTQMRRFSITDEPDALPTAAVYADSTLLGAGTVAAGPGVQDYTVTYTLPSTVTVGQRIMAAIDCSVNGEALQTCWLDFGVVSALCATAAQVDGIPAAILAAATANPIHANIKQIDDEPVKPIDEDKIICRKKLEVS